MEGLGQWQVKQFLDLPPKPFGFACSVNQIRETIGRDSVDLTEILLVHTHFCKALFNGPAIGGYGTFTIQRTHLLSTFQPYDIMK
ncbi:hypothetical protein PWYN_06645 [Paenibacillus wynnii]|uniref:Uncharacterized protein n=1 Tax=Paenibacillus wynnii TaxID=268407 RepID=A0A098MBY4_9BACL|nr:hypothetical protein PWYN_06645 [Paenibacillus wynnii]